MLLEHVSITVRDLESMASFLQVAFPSFRVRGGGEMDHGTWKQKWSHVGNDEYYVALYQSMPDAVDRPAAHTFTPSVNHVGVAVADVDVVKERLLKAGYKEGFIPAPHPNRRRVYFIDPEGFEWEFVQYLSEEYEIRNQY